MQRPTTGLNCRAAARFAAARTAARGAAGRIEMEHACRWGARRYSVVSSNSTDFLAGDVRSGPVKLLRLRIDPERICIEIFERRVSPFLPTLATLRPIRLHRPRAWSPKILRGNLRSDDHLAGDLIRLALTRTANFLRTLQVEKEYLIRQSGQLPPTV